MEKKIIAILYGGRTGEHEVSCRSAASVVASLDSEVYTPLLVGIDKRGNWYLQQTAAYTGSGDVRYLVIEANEERRVTVVPGRGLAVGGRPLAVDLVFPVLHGTFGEDGTMQGLLEIAGIPYAGAGVLGSALAMDKAMVKSVWQRADLPVVPFVTISKAEAAGSPQAIERLGDAARARFGMPLFVKPVRAGSSVGVGRVDSLEQLSKAVETALRFDLDVMVEPCVIGREIECSVVGNANPEAYGPGEIISSHAFYDYKAKYLDPDGARLVIPADIPEKGRAEVRSLAVKAYRAAGIEGMARVDFFLEAKSGAILLNEINTIPGFTNISMFSRMCEASGLRYADLLGRIITLGLERHRAHEGLQYFFSPATSG